MQRLCGSLVIFWHHKLASSMGKLRLISHITFRTKSCMVRTPSMATTTNNQGDEPRPTTLERQVQTLTTAVERLTNHDLEEQLHQKNAAMDTKKEDQEGTSAERRNQEGPKGSNTPSRLKWQDTCRPSVTDTVPPHIVVEMQMMKEHMDFMMNALRGWVFIDLDDLVHRTNSTFTISVTSFPLSPKFRMPQVENYNGSKDPLDHLESFKTLMHLQGVPDEIMCRAFPTTLKGSARIWFNRLTPSSIGTFKELSAQFASHFIRGTGIKSLLRAWWTLNNGRMRR